MRAIVVQEYGQAPVVSEIAEPAGETATVLAASMNPVDVTVAAGLNPFRRPAPPLVLGLDGVARRPDGTLVHFFQPPAPYGAFAERVPLAGAETVPLPAGLDPGLAAALGISGVAAWTGLAVTGALRPGESVLVLGANGQVGRVAVQAARLLGARRVAGVVSDEADVKVPLRLGADVVESSRDTATLTDRLLAADRRGYDVILDLLWGPVIDPAIGAAARGARVVHLGNAAGVVASLTATAVRKNGVSILPYAIFALPERARSDAFARLAAHAAAGELTVEYVETSLAALPDVWGDFTAGQVADKLVVRPLASRGRGVELADDLLEQASGGWKWPVHAAGHPDLQLGLRHQRPCLHIAGRGEGVSRQEGEANAGPDELGRRRHVRDLHHDGALHPGLGQHGVGQLPRAPAREELHELAVRQGSQRDRVVIEQLMVGGKEQYQRLGADEDSADAGMADPGPRANQGEVKFACVQPLEQLGRPVDRGVRLDGDERAKLAEPLKQVADLREDHNLGEAEANGAADAVGHLTDGRRRLAHRPQDGLGIVQEHAAGLAELDRVARPLEQADVQRALQGAHRDGQAGLRDVQPPGGPGEVAFLCHGDEVLQMPQFHRVLLTCASSIQACGQPG